MKQSLNKIKDKFIKLNKKQKIGILGGIFCVFLVVLVISLVPSFSSTESGYLIDQTVSGLSFENPTLEVSNGISKYTVEVTNDLEEVYSLKNINIIFKDESGKEIETLLGYIGDTLEVGETKLIDASIDTEITDITTIEYVINK